MSSIPNYKMKKNNTLGIKTKKKAIPININTNPAPGKFLFSNHVNNIASSYLSMGRRIQINKNIKASKIIHVNTNSATNYYTLNTKDTRQTNGSITNSLINNIKNNNNKSEYNSININNYININNNNSQSQQQNSEIIKVSNAHSKDKQLSTISNSKINNDILINGYQSSKNNINNSKFKNKANNSTTTNNLSKNKKTYSTRPNFLDSKIKTKKMPMKSKIRQYKYQYKNNKPISTSFNNVYMTKRHFQGSYQRDILNYVRNDLLSNINNEKNYENYFTKNNFNLIHKNLYEIKNRHNRHNTASFGNKEIMNIFHKKNLSSKMNNFYNNINSNNNIHNLNENNEKNIKHSVNKNNINNDANLIVYNIINKINNSNNSKKKIKKLSNGKINDIKIYVNEKNINSKENKNNSNNNKKINSYHNFYYTKYLSNNYNSNNNNNVNIAHHQKNQSNININITGIKKILVKQKENKKINKNKITNNPIPTPSQKIKTNMIPSQRNIKINLAKFLKGVKTKPNNKGKLIVGRKSLSIKKISKENNSDFFISQLNDKITNILLKNKEEENININNYNTNKNNNIQNKNEEIIEKNENDNDDNNKNSKNENIENDLISDIYHNNNNKNTKNKNDKCIFDFNCHSNNSTTNNINNKNDYSIDNMPGPININNKLNLQRKKSIDNELQNITDLNNSNPNININNIINEKNKQENEIIKNKKDKNSTIINTDINKIKIIKKETQKLINNNIKNTLFDEENLDELPEDYDENFNDLYSIINKINFGSVLMCVEGLFTPEGRTYKKYKDKFDKFYDKLYAKKGNSFANSNSKQKKIVEVGGLTSNAKTNSSSSKKNIVSPNMKYNDLNIVKELNVNC